MKHNHKMPMGRVFRMRAVTLIELLLCLALISMIVIGFFSIDTFSRHHLLTADRRAKVQNDLSLVMEHMSKKIMMGIGDASQYPLNLNVNCLAVAIDSNANGRYDPGTDRVQSYCCSGGTITYCDAASFAAPGTCTGTREVLSNHIASCISSATVIVNPDVNYALINLTACWNTTAACGTPENPSVNMNSRVYMPSISVK
jgi:hypothetical protein